MKSGRMPTVAFLALKI